MKTAELMERLVTEFPEFRERCEEHLRYWQGEEAGPYNDMAEFVHFVVEDLYEGNQIDRVRYAFQVLEKLLSEGDREVVDVISLGFFETLQNFASWRPYGSDPFKQFLGPASAKVWAELDQIWKGKSSLMDVIRSEKGTRKT